MEWGVRDRRERHDEPRGGDSDRWRDNRRSTERQRVTHHPPSIHCRRYGRSLRSLPSAARSEWRMGEGHILSQPRIIDL